MFAQWGRKARNDGALEVLPRRLGAALGSRNASRRGGWATATAPIAIATGSAVADSSTTAATGTAGSSWGGGRSGCAACDTS